MFVMLFVDIVYNNCYCFRDSCIVLLKEYRVIHGRHYESCTAIVIGQSISCFVMENQTLNVIEGYR